MKRVYFSRHAKSSWDNPQLSDAERPLLNKGIKRTTRVADYLKARKIKPELIISSHAIRAVETARLIAGGLNYAPESIKIDERLYFHGHDNIFGILYELPESLKSVMLIGHNPDMTNAVNFFLHEKIDFLPTSGVIGIKFDMDEWPEIMMAGRTVEIIAFPKMI